MNLIALVPGFIAAFVAATDGPAQAFVTVYLPSLLLVPAYFRAVLPGVPKPSFNESAMCAITFFYFLEVLKGKARYRLSFADLLVWGFAAAVIYSQYINTGYKDAQHLGFEILASGVFPYMMAKALIQPAGITVLFARRFCWFLVAVVCVASWEFRFGKNPFNILLGPLFPGQLEGRFTLIRWGFGRIAGPFGHSILCGIMMAAGFLLSEWLRRYHPWDRPWKPRLVGAALVGGMIATMSRGPWLGALIGLVAGSLGRAANRWRAFVLLLVAAVAIGTPAFLSFKAYVAVGRAGAKSETQETAAYRKELVEKYTVIVLKRSVWGWGLITWPQVEGMPSVDNHWLLLALRHGLVAVSLMLGIFVIQGLRLFFFGMNAPPGSSAGAIAFTLMSIYLAMLVSISTVYMGLQSQHLFFIVTGWAEGLLLAGAAAREGGAAEPARIPAHRFRRVIV